MADKKKITSKNLSKLFLFVDNNSENNLCRGEKGIPTVCTPIPSGQGSIIEQEKARQPQLAKKLSENDVSSAKKSKKKKKKKRRNVIVVKPCDSPEDTPVPSARSCTPLSVNSCIDSSCLRYSVPIQIYFMQRRLGSTEIPTDGCIRLPLVYALKKVGNKIDNHYSFYLFASIFDIHWKRSRNMLMKQATNENDFRTLLKPSTVDYNLIDISKLMELDEMNNLNLYIFIKDINGDVLIETPDNNAWTFENVFEK